MTTGYNKFFNEARRAKSAPPPETPTKARARDPRLAGRAQEDLFAAALRSRAGAPSRIHRADHRKDSVAGARETAETLRNRLREKPRRRGRAFPWVSVAAIFIFLAVGLWGLQHQKNIDGWTQNIEVSIFGEAHAQEKGPAAKDPGPAAPATGGATTADANAAAGKDSGKSTDATNEEKKGKNTYTAEDVDHFAKLNERKMELDAREEELTRAEKELKSQQEELDKRMKELESTRVSISKLLEERVQTDDKKVDSLVEMYSNMKPQQAAKVFETLDEDLAIEILGRMKKKNAAEVMNLLKPEKAQVFSERYAGYKKKP